MRAVACLALAAVGCTPASGGTLDDPKRGRYQIHQQVDDLRTIERMVLAGELEQAKTLVYFVTLRPGCVRDAAEGRDIALSASALMSAKTSTEALDAEVQIATECARCHERLGAALKLREPFNAPPDTLDIKAQMKRNQWAVDRLWEGLVGPSNDHWRAGLYVFATSPLEHVDTHPRVANELQLRTRAALDARDTPSIDQRAAMYRAILGSCVDCHAKK